MHGEPQCNGGFTQPIFFTEKMKTKLNLKSWNGNPELSIQSKGKNRSAKMSVSSHYESDMNQNFNLKKSEKCQKLPLVSRTFIIAIKRALCLYRF